MCGCNSQCAGCAGNRSSPTSGFIINRSVRDDGRPPLDPSVDADRRMRERFDRLALRLETDRRAAEAAERAERERELAAKHQAFQCGMSVDQMKETVRTGRPAIMLVAQLNRYASCIGITVPGEKTARAVNRALQSPGDYRAVILTMLEPNS